MVRRRFGGPEGDELKYMPLVDPALRRLAYDVAKDPSLRDWMLTDPTTTTVTLDANGAADLAPLILSPRILLDCLKYGDIYPPVDPNYPTQPFRLVENAGQGLLSGAYDALVLKAWIDGTTLRTKPPDNATPLVGDISFRVPYWATLPQLEESLVQKLVDGPYWTPAETTKANATK